MTWAQNEIHSFNYYHTTNELLGHMQSEIQPQSLPQA